MKKKFAEVLKKTQPKKILVLQKGSGTARGAKQGNAFQEAQEVRIFLRDEGRVLKQRSFKTRPQQNSCFRKEAEPSLCKVKKYKGKTKILKKALE